MWASITKPVLTICETCLRMWTYTSTWTWCLVIRDWSLSKVVNCLVWWWQVLNDEYIACWYSCGNSKQRESNVSSPMMNILVVGSHVPTSSKETAMWTFTCYIVIDFMFCFYWLMSKTYFKPIQLKGSAIPNFLNLQVVANVLRQVLEALGLEECNQPTCVTKYALVLLPSSYAKESDCGCLVFGIFL